MVGRRLAAALPRGAFLLLPLVRAWVDPSDVGGSPAFTDLAHPATVLADLFVTGYYPVVAWLGFLLVGLAVGRSDLSRPPVALALLVGGTAVAAAARWGSAELLAAPGADAALRAATGLGAQGLDTALATGQRLDGAQQSLVVVRAVRPAHRVPAGPAPRRGHGAGGARRLPAGRGRADGDPGPARRALLGRWPGRARPP